MPKLWPAPFMPQNKFELLLMVTSEPLARTTFMDTNWSATRPCRP